VHGRRADPARRVRLSQDELRVLVLHELPFGARGARRPGRHVLSARFGKYSVVYRLGVGGMAEVFKCRLSGLGGFNKLVVVKRIRPELASDPAFVDMFL